MSTHHQPLIRPGPLILPETSAWRKPPRFEKMSCAATSGAAGVAKSPPTIRGRGKGVHNSSSLVFPGNGTINGIPGLSLLNGSHRFVPCQGIMMDMKDPKARWMTTSLAPSKTTGLFSGTFTNMSWTHPSGPPKWLALKGKPGGTPKAASGPPF